MPDEHHSTSNDDDYYRDMPDLLTDDEETDDACDDEESVYQSEALKLVDSYVGRSTHQRYLTLVEWQWRGQWLTRGIHHYHLPADWITFASRDMET
jgi:hypothetical protein